MLYHPIINVIIGYAFVKPFRMMCYLFYYYFSFFPIEMFLFFYNIFELVIISYSTIVTL